MKAICPVCGCKFDNAKEHGGRPKRFCSVRCRGIYHCRQHNRKQREAKIAAIKPRPCAHCGKEFKPSVYRSNQKFCSHSCWLEARRTEYAAKRAEERAARPTKTCAFCGKEFTSARQEAVYCSKKCGNIDYRRKHAAKFRQYDAVRRARNISASKARNAAPNITFVQKSEPQERSSIARVEAYLSLPAAERWARRDTLTKKEQAMARDLWLKMKCQRPVYHSAMAN